MFDANLSHTDINFRYARVRFVDFTGAKLNQGDFTGANLEGTDLYKAAKKERLILDDTGY